MEKVKKNKNVLSNHAIVGSDSGNVLFQKENGNVYFRNTQKSEVLDGDRKFDRILKWIHELKHELGIEISIDVRNVFDDLNAEYEEKEFFYNADFKSPLIDGFLDVNGEIISNYLILNRCKDAVFNSVILNNVTEYKGNIDLIVEYSSDKINWHEYKTFSFNNPKPVSKTKEFKLTKFKLNRGNNSGGRFNVNSCIFRNSKNVVLTKAHIVNTSKHEHDATLYYNNGSMTFWEYTPTYLKEELTIDRNVILDVPGSADSGWTCDFYGYVKDPLHSGKDIIRGTQYWNNMNIEGFDPSSVPIDYIFESDRRVETETRTMFVRLKLRGKGSIKTDGRVNFLINSVGTSIVREDYTQNIDEEKDIYINNSDQDTLYPFRDLFHKEFNSRYNLPEQKNYKQTLTLNLVLNGGSKVKVLQETYTSNFVHNIKFKQPSEKEFMLFESNETISPTIMIPSKVKQLLYKNGNNYVNKKIIDIDSNFSSFGYEIIEGIKKYDSSCKLLDKLVTKDLDKIKFTVDSQKKFSEILIENEIKSVIRDFSGRLIFKGKIILSNETNIDETDIIYKIKNHKTFNRINMIIYSETNSKIEDLVTALYAGNTTPQDVFLICQNPNESNIELCHFNKTELGQEAFLKKLLKSLKNKCGLQFTSIEEIFNNIDSYINDNIEKERFNSLFNTVGVNIYDFTNSFIEEDYINRYGYFINKKQNDFIRDKSIKLINTSNDNTISGVTQYDIGSFFEAEIDLTNTFKNATKDFLREDLINSKSISITHVNNIFWKFIVGEEEIKIFEDELNSTKYSCAINSTENKTVLKINNLFPFTEENIGKNYFVINIKDKNAIVSTYIAEFVVDYKEPSKPKITVYTSDEIEEVGYEGTKDKCYTADNFITLGLSLEGEYNFDKTDYKILIENSKIKDYKIERKLKGNWSSKLFTFHFDDFKNEKDLEQKLKFGDWDCKIIRSNFNHCISNEKLNVPLTINDAIEYQIIPANLDIEDIDNDGLQQGKDLYVNFGFGNSEYFKTIKDWIYFCKEVRFLSNKENFTLKPEYFTYRDLNSLNDVTSHLNIEDINKRTSMRWFLSGINENNSNKFLKPIANLAGDSKKTKDIKIQFLLWDDKIIETLPITVGKTGEVSTPIVLGSEEHFQKLIKIEAKTLDKNPLDLTSEEIKKVKNKTNSLGELNHSHQQTVNKNKIFVFYTNLIEIQFDFGNAEYFTISQANNTTEMIPIVKDGKVRYVIDINAIDEQSRGSITIKGYIKLSDGLVLSSNEKVINFIRKKRPSLVQTGDDYTKYIQYEVDERNYYNLKTVIQSKIVLENLNDNYSSKWINHITADLVDVDKRTVIAYGPKIQFYDGFIPQRFVFDSGLTEEELNKLKDDERLEIEATKKYAELEKILNEKIFSTGKYEGQTFYLRFKAVEKVVDYYGKEKEILGEISFYPIKFTEALKELVIIPATGIIVKEEENLENYYTYKNKVSFVLESNNAEYFMYRTDRSAAFQKVYPKNIGYTKTVKIIVPTYDIGNHFLEVKQKAIGEPESNVYGVIVEKINAVKPPKIISDSVVDDNPSWTIVPLEDTIKFETKIITDGKEHSNKMIEAMQYEMKIESDLYLDNGYHIFQARAYDKINNYSDYSYFITRKIGRPIPSKITGLEKTSNEFIEWIWKSQYYEGVRNYEVEVNGIEKNVLPASLDGYNKFNIRHFQGRDLVDGTYEIRIWSINELGNKSYTYSSFLTHKGTHINEIAYKFYKFKDDYTNRLECEVITDDPAIKFFEYEIFKNINGEIVSHTGVLTTNNKKIPFISLEGNEIKLENGQYYFALRGVNGIGEKTPYVQTPFYFKMSLPEKPFIYYEKSVKTRNPVIFTKETGNEMIFSIEVKIGDNQYEKVRNNVWRPNYSVPLGINNVVFKVTDYAGNIAEYSDFIEITSKGINLFQGDYIADMNRPILEFDFNMEQMSNFGHSNFRVQQETLGIDNIITIKNANSIEIPLSSSSDGVYPDGEYIFTIKLYDDLTKGYDYIVDNFRVTIDSKKPLTPYFLNNGYDGIEYNKQYTKSRNPKWIWQTKDIANIYEYIVDLYIYDEKENNYVPYGNKQFIDFSTKLVGQFQTPDELKDGTYKLNVRSIGLNKLSSDIVTFFMVVKNTLPKPPFFDLDELINKKYENKNIGVTWSWKDSNIGNDVLIKYKLKINNEEFTDEFDSNITYYEETRMLQDGPNKIVVIGCDKAGNWSSSNEISAIQLGNNYLTHTKIIDTKTPENLKEKDIIINILNSNSFEVLFRNENKKEEYFLFELFTLNQNREEIHLVKGNTLPKGTENIYFYDKEVVPGVSLGELSEDNGYCEIKYISNGDNIEKSLYFTNLLTNDYFIRIYGVDYAGNITEEFIKEVKIQDLTKIKPMFILPKETYTNNSTIIFQWLLNEENIKCWEYQLITPYSNSKADLINDEKWKTINTNMFKLNNIPKIVAGRKADGEYTLYVRAVFDETVIQEETQLEINKKSDVGSITVFLDREIPQGIIFTNKTYTSDNSVLRWTWEYTGDGDIANGVYVSFNPNLPIEEWEKINNKTEYTSFKERLDGVYTLYLKTFDLAGNINETIFSNTITLDRIPPFKPFINGGTHIYTNIIPTVEWENDVNYYKYSWVIVELEEFKRFKNVYDEIINIENYTLTNDDWSYLFYKNKDDINPNNVHDKLKQFNFKNNDAIKENFVIVNSSNNKNGISEEGEYVFLLSGYDENYNWAEEFEYQFITYDLTAPDFNKLKFISPLFVVTTERRPEWIWETTKDVTYCNYSLEKNGYNDGSINGKIYKSDEEELDKFTYKFKPDFNLTQGSYNLIVDCYDKAGNNVRISKSVIIEGESTVFEDEFFDIFLPGINNRIRCKKHKYSKTYTIIDIDIDKNSVLTYRESGKVDVGFKIFELGKTELNIEVSYDFNITSYKLIAK